MTAPSPPVSPAAPPQQSGSALTTAAQIAAVVAAYQAATVATRTPLEAFVRSLWRSLGEWREPDIKRFVAQVVPVVEGAMGHMSSLTSGYLASLAQAAGKPGLNTPPPRVPTIARVRNGADPADVYGRPFHLVWRQLADLPHEPGSVEQAIGAGEDRAVQTALTDVQLAKTHTAQQSMAADRKIVGYRRELEGAYSCGLCIVASTIRYHKADLMPIHPACDCQPVPLYSDEETDWQRAADARLAASHQAIADRFGKSSAAARIIPDAKAGKGGPLLYKDALIVHDHGEIGPVLGVRGVDWVSPKNLKK